jgi:DNA-binding response OmpR family regulator
MALARVDWWGHGKGKTNLAGHHRLCDFSDRAGLDCRSRRFVRFSDVPRSATCARSLNLPDMSGFDTGDLCVNLDAKTVEVAGARVHLTGKEYKVLELLALRKGSTLTKETFLNHLYGGMDEPEGKIIDVFMCKLRKKLASASGGIDYIETVWGQGYVLREPTEDEARISA